MRTKSYMSGNVRFCKNGRIHSKDMQKIVEHYQICYEIAERQWEFLASFEGLESKNAQKLRAKMEFFNNIRRDLKAR